MDLIGGLVVFFVLVSLILIRVVIDRTRRSRYQENLDSKDDVDQAIRNKSLRYLALFGMTISSAISFVGVLTLVFSTTREARLTGTFADDVLPTILASVAVIVGIAATIGIVRVYRKL